ncbi:nicotinamide/nicotinic acid mononucleotide adenylyltransferase 1-like [Hydractinia symbiolongicarpus]|uniref:nicotinamide/nicotinic acid mononucleotide adenylyltransferase 1-like n=1 Tax=Hydractinia symbiolongicarpus TaxID=13093 RepID=UPI0025504F56|nr:nicotinamide/nicotinic acid mononucleotide adenylyltransferase 1-like [Hydractinia symbiolongicarpus]
MATGEFMKKNVLLLSCGCYSPITHMHLRLYELARDVLHKTGKFNVVGGIVSPTHDGYKKKGLVAADHRIEMCRRATKSSDWLRVSTWETEQDDWTETRKALQHFQELANNQSGECSDLPPNVVVKLLCGADLIESFNVPGLWKDDDVEAIASSYGLVVITRAGSFPIKFVDEHKILQKYKDNIHIIDEWIPNEISSTKIRLALSRNESIKYLVADSVIEYIKEHKLYR